MRLKRFWAAEVHGYINLDISFNSKLNFLIGPNGSGKSTALALMEAMLTPSIRELALTEFSEARLVIEDSNEERFIWVVRGDEDIVVTVSWIEEPLIIRRLDKKKRELLASDQRAADDYFSKLSFEYSSSAVISAISKISAPIFLGIERQQKNRAIDDELMSDGDIYRLDSRKYAQAKRFLHGNLSPGLLDSQMLIQEGYRSALKRVDSDQNKLREEFLLASFRYSDLNSDIKQGMYFGSITDEEMLRLRESKNEITKALINLGISEDRVDHKVGVFYSKLTHLTDRLDRMDEDSGADDTLFEFLMNRGQIDRLLDLISLVQNYKQETDKTFEKVNNFRSQMNWFFNDSGKRFSLDQVGRVRINRPTGSVMPLDALSSGERQLFIIFSHVFFNAFGSRSKVFVVDEPELSLHLRWQENLVDRIQSVLPEVQLVFATHSPDIVGGRDECCIEVSG